MFNCLRENGTNLCLRHFSHFHFADSFETKERVLEKEDQRKIVNMAMKRAWNWTSEYNETGDLEVFEVLLVHNMLSKFSKADLKRFFFWPINITMPPMCSYTYIFAFQTYSRTKWYDSCIFTNEWILFSPLSTSWHSARVFFYFIYCVADSTYFEIAVVMEETDLTVQTHTFHAQSIDVKYNKQPIKLRIAIPLQSCACVDDNT